MTRSSLLALAAATAALAGCAHYVAETAHFYRVRAPFDAEQTARLMAPGTSTISGSALLRQKGGGVVTCAGLPVLIEPATSYARERMSYIYGLGVDDGFEQEQELAPIFDPEPQAFRDAVRTTLCDAQGRFIFDEMSAGDFYVVTTIHWSVMGHREGGVLMKLVHVRPGKTETPVLAR